MKFSKRFIPGAKMLACKGIFATPTKGLIPRSSAAEAAAKRRVQGLPWDLIPFIIRIVLTLLPCLLISVALLACKQEQLNNYVYDNFDKIYYVESYQGDTPPIAFESEKIDLDYGTVIFDKKLSNKQKNRFTTYCEQLLNYLQPEESLTYYVSPKLYTLVDEDAYFYYNGSLDKIELITYTLICMTDNDVNYGMIYGLSSLIDSELDWNSDSYKSVKDTVSYIDKNPHILDLEYPQFLKEFASKNERAYVKSAARYLMEYIFSIEGREKIAELIEQNIVNSFDFYQAYQYEVYPHELFNLQITEYKNMWLQSNGSSLQINCNHEFYYTVSARKYAFIVQSSWMSYYFPKGYKERFFKYNFDYLGLKNFIVKTESSFQKVRDFVNYTNEDYLKKPKAFLGHISEEVRNQEGVLGFATRNGEEIYALSLAIVVHEYTHAVTLQLYYNNTWMLEGIARYCETQFNDFFHDMLRREINADKNKSSHKTWISKYNVWLKAGNEFCAMDFYDLFVYMHPDSFDQYIHGSSLTNYLISTYGKELYMKLYSSNADVFSAYGKSGQEILDEWANYIKEKFQSVIK